MRDRQDSPPPGGNEVAYHLRRARQERDLARLSPSTSARLAHRALADLHDEAAREAALEHESW